MKARVDIEIYEEWKAEFRRLRLLRPLYIEDIEWAKSEEDLYNRVRNYLKSRDNQYLDVIAKERRVKIKIGKGKYDLLIERKEFHRLNSNNPLFKEDDDRIGELWRRNPGIFYM